MSQTLLTHSFVAWRAIHQATSLFKVIQEFLRFILKLLAETKHACDICTLTRLKSLNHMLTEIRQQCRCKAKCLLREAVPIAGCGAQIPQHHNRYNDSLHLGPRALRPWAKEVTLRLDTQLRGLDGALHCCL